MSVLSFAPQNDAGVNGGGDGGDGGGDGGDGDGLLLMETDDERERLD